MSESIDLKESRPKNDFIHRIASCASSLEDLRENGLKRGEHVGFEGLYKKYSVKLGSMTFIIAPPAVGKTAMLYEMLINLAEFSDYKVAIFSPEGGSPTDLYAEMLWAVLRKPFLKHEIPDVANASESEVKDAMAFLKKHFYIIDSGLRDLTAESFFRAVEDIELEDNIKINAIVIDPVVELNYNNEGLRDDIALGSFLTKVRKFSSDKNIHTFIAIHTKAMTMLSKKKEDGTTMLYYPQPTFFDTMGGMMWSRKGYMVMSLWRPPSELINPDTNLNYEKNETIIEILKVKPKIMGTTGRVSLFYDRMSSRFYEKDGLGNKIFSSDILESDKEVEKSNQETIKFDKK
jgi:twinkle protein